MTPELIKEEDGDSPRFRNSKLSQSECETKNKTEEIAFEKRNRANSNEHMLETRSSENHNELKITEMKTQKTEPFIEAKIVIHRLPYMKMNPKIVWKYDRFFYLFVFAVAIQGLNQFLQQIYAAFMASFNVFIFPGFFFYAANKERILKCFSCDEEPYL